MADVHYIVSKLNASPFNLGVSLLTFRSGLPQPTAYRWPSIMKDATVLTTVANMLQ
jgi:hypothetical protein